MWQNVDQTNINTLFMTCYLGHMTSDITPDILHMRVGEHGKMFTSLAVMVWEQKCFKDMD